MEESQERLEKAWEEFRAKEVEHASTLVAKDEEIAQLNRGMEVLKLAKEQEAAEFNRRLVDSNRELAAATTKLAEANKELEESRRKLQDAKEKARGYRASYKRAAKMIQRLRDELPSRTLDRWLTGAEFCDYMNS